MQDTRSVLQRYVNESENWVKTDTRAVGIVIDGEVCDIHCNFVVLNLPKKDNWILNTHNSFMALLSCVNESTDILLKTAVDVSKSAD